jgi:site-specific DNA-methyltransferase (adenine-specific)
MAPASIEPTWDIVCGDCRSIAPSLGLFDLIVADPPYCATPLRWDRQVDGWVEAVAAVLKPTGSIWVFGSISCVPRLFAAFGKWKLAQDLVWEKHNGSGPVSARKLNRVHEHVLQWYRGRWSDVWAEQPRTHGHVRKVVSRGEAGEHRGRYGEMSTYDSSSRVARSVQKIRSCHHGAHHPTEKPLELLRFLIRYSCSPGGRVLDPFAGSGSTVRAAQLEGRSAVGIEVDARYCDVARGLLRG